MGVSRGIVDAEAHILQDPAPLQIARSIFWTARGDLFDVGLALNKAVKGAFDN
jgi:hypothetical protein